jgi:hypothetical protein
MAPDFDETFDRKGKIAPQPVRYRTEISMGFPQSGAKFLAGLRRDSHGAA